MLTTGLVGPTPQGLDLETLQLLLNFFTIEELINELHLRELELRDLTIVKATILQEIAAQISRNTVVKEAVKTRALAIVTLLGRPHA